MTEQCSNYVLHISAKEIAVHHLTVKDTGIVQLVEFTRELLLGLLKAADIAGARVWKWLQEASWGLTQCNPRGAWKRESHDTKNSSMNMNTKLKNCWQCLSIKTRQQIYLLLGPCLGSVLLTTGFKMLDFPGVFTCRGVSTDDLGAGFVSPFTGGTTAGGSLRFSIG